LPGHLLIFFMIDYHLHLILKLISRGAKICAEVCEKYENALGRFLETYVSFEGDGGADLQTAVQVGKPLTYSTFEYFK
jgi:hypothetical protein